MKNYLKYTFILFAITWLTSCEDFLTEDPKTSRTAENYYRTATDFKNATVGLYAALKHPGVYGNGGTNSSLLFMTEIVSDNATLGTNENTATFTQFQIEELNFQLTNPFITNAWVGHYIGIGRANALLENLPYANLPDATKARYEGEAKFMRAFFYFNLVRLFGDVQLVVKTFKDPTEEFNIPRTSTSQIYDLIISDLTFAETNLPIAILSEEAGRASRWAAKALLGKVYLTRNQSNQAELKLKEVIDANLFNLTSVSYAETFSPSTPYASNRDVIWAVQYKSGLKGQGSALWSAMIPFGFNGASFGTTGTGEGFMKPTTDMVNAYEANDVRKNASLRTTFTRPDGTTGGTPPYVFKYNQFGPQAGDADSDLPVLRYADVLLMFAEALNAQNKTAEALPYVNQVRTRAGLGAISASGKDDLALKIEKERRVEFAFEGHRWFDLVRTGRYKIVMENHGFTNVVKDHHKLYPIPQRENDLKNIGQNSGY
jgi:starch-binding outer membrane protein, SusD/RagB family